MARHRRPAVCAPARRERRPGAHREPLGCSPHAAAGQSTRGKDPEIPSAPTPSFELDVSGARRRPADRESPLAAQPKAGNGRPLAGGGRANRLQRRSLHSCHASDISYGPHARPSWQADARPPSGALGTARRPHALGYLAGQTECPRSRYVPHTGFPVQTGHKPPPSSFPCERESR
jgi:hypothetical protein